MFVDALIGNLVLFAVAQVCAWLYLRRGRFWLGAGVTVLLWLFVDWWLVARLLLASPADAQRVPLTGLQIVAVAVTVAYGWALWRRAGSRRERPAMHRAAVQQALAGDHRAAQDAFARLTWLDPWDASAWLGRGDALRRGGEDRRARRAYARAAAVDVAGRFGDLIAHRRALLAKGAAVVGRAAARGGVSPRPSGRRKSAG